MLGWLDMSEYSGPDADRDKASPLPAKGGGTLLQITDFEAAQPSHILHALRDHWESLRINGNVPARSDVQPRGIRAALDHAFILERIAPGAARFRLAGRHLIDLMGMEVRGMPICALLNTSSRGRFSDVLESVFRGPQIAELGLSSPAGYARPVLQGRLLLLPLRSDLGDVARALGCFVSQGEIGQAPRRFDLAEERLSPIHPGGPIIEPSASPDPARAGSWRKATGRSATPAEATPEQRRALFRIVSDRSRDR